MVTSRQLHELEKTQQEKRLRSWGDEEPAQTKPVEAAPSIPAPKPIPPPKAKGSGDKKLRELLDHLLMLQIESRDVKRKRGIDRQTFEIPLDLAQELREISEQNGIPLRFIIIDAAQKWLEEFRQLLYEHTNTQ
jgi:hypothetical protein